VITAGSKWGHLNKGGRDFRTLAAYQDGSPACVHSLATLPLLLLIHPARDGNQHEPERVENAHCSTVSWALCIIFNAFDF
jgi:hypothetical protein